ncbi:MAG: SDR family oxidoreductase [Cytophagales bacterium]|nr:SDR family oxidoreductase [Cytophagales bacterium]
MKKILITGANGLLGQKLIFLLSNLKGVEVIATGRGRARIDLKNARYINMDLANRNEVFANVLKAAPTHIVHTAAMTQVDRCETEKELCRLNNVVASENLIRVAKALKAYFQYLSTDFVFDGNGGPYREDDPPNPINFYGKSKYAVEQQLEESRLDYSIVRTVLVYGVGNDLSRSNIVLWVKKKLEYGEKINVVNDQWRTPTLVEDLAMGCKLIIDQKAVGIYHLSGKDYITAHDIAIKTAEVFELDKRLIAPTNADEFKEIAMRPLKTGLDISKAGNELGFKPVCLEDGLKLVKEQLLNLEKTKSL